MEIKVMIYENTPWAAQEEERELEKGDFHSYLGILSR